jgi:transposase InsO family protein
VYTAVESIAQNTAVPLAEICETLDVSRSAYYAWIGASPSVREEKDMFLMPIVRKIFYRHKRRYGARRVVEELGDLGHSCGVRRASKLLKIQGLKAIQPKSFKPRTTESKHTLGYNPNLLLDLEEPEGTNQLWVGDITYVPIVGNQFLYLAMLMDRYSRRIVGWKLSDDMTDSLVIAVVRQGIQERQPKAALIHHTDRGGQYASTRYRDILRRADMQQSMSRAGDCYDNAFMESCFGTIKMELEMTEYENKQTALKEIRAFIAYYNTQRKHSSIGYLAPSQFEAI